jgi:hypothetical protein
MSRFSFFILRHFRRRERKLNERNIRCAFQFFAFSVSLSETRE